MLKQQNFFHGTQISSMVALFHFQRIHFNTKFDVSVTLQYKSYPIINFVQAIINKTGNHNIAPDFSLTSPDLIELSMTS